MAVPKYVCERCMYTGKPLRFRRGSTKVEILLWFCLILPGLVYTIWRTITWVRVCPNCHTATMISTKTAHGQRLIGA